mmetsp:Transcript_20252/g.61695  ORF Transcript_20252/g.61695 Transcript_20252/m.61695 type:complete len:102 (+) Transcript_20252:333-638(+)|eukprot:scaffold76261_cov33-Tisochrysis_lutea.AAC.9
MGRVAATEGHLYFCMSLGYDALLNAPELPSAESVLGPALLFGGMALSQAEMGLIATRAVASSERPQAMRNGSEGAPKLQPSPKRVPYKVGPTTFSSDRKFW